VLRSLRILVLDPEAETIVAAVRTRVSAEASLVSAIHPDAVAEGEAATVCLGRPDMVAVAAERMPALAWVQSTWAGVRPLLPLMAERPALSVSAAKGIFGDAIAEYVVGWLLALDRRLLDYSAQQARAEWAPLWERGLSGRKAVVLGTGSIGARVAERMAQFGMEVVGVSRKGEQVPAFVRCWPVAERLTAARGADVLVNTLPETPRTWGLVDAEMYAALARDARIINVGRGSAIDEGALLAGIGQRRPGAAVLDVFEDEPLPPEHPYWSTPGIHVTPHIAARTEPKEIARLFAENLARHRRGAPLVGAVDPALGY